MSAGGDRMVRRDAYRRVPAEAREKFESTYARSLLLMRGGNWVLRLSLVYTLLAFGYPEAMQDELLRRVSMPLVIAGVATLIGAGMYCLWLVWKMQRLIGEHAEHVEDKNQ